jgi:soluble lytic murein transglycosylase
MASAIRSAAHDAIRHVLLRRIPRVKTTFGVPRGVRVVVAAAVGLLFLAALWLLDSGDPDHAVKELLSFGRYGAYDELIEAAAAKRGLPPELVKAVVWRESRFHSEKRGKQGEYGLMQVMEPAAAEWAAAEGIEVFVPTDLLDAKTNLDAGTWYLARALKHWEGRDQPLPFALAEYNAGRSRAKRWAADAADAQALLEAMDFPGTRAYIATILERAEFYRNRGDFRPSPGR